MPLELLAPLVVLGVAIVVLAVHVSGGSRPLSLATEAAVRAAWAEAEPDRPLSEVLPCPDGRAAVVIDGAGVPALLWTLGADPVVRELHPGVLRAVEERREAIRLYLDDFAAPVVEIGVPDTAVRAVWIARFRRFSSAAEPGAASNPERLAPSEISAQ
ncbi:MAG: hypothetical protein AAGE18_03715 [Pseudomonadota bacterium]